MIKHVYLENICPEDKEIAQKGSRGLRIGCFSKKCSKDFYVIKEFKMKNVTCPHCGSMYKVRAYKNGKTSVHIVRGGEKNIILKKLISQCEAKGEEIKTYFDKSEKTDTPKAVIEGVDGRRHIVIYKNDEWTRLSEEEFLNNITGGDTDGI